MDAKVIKDSKVVLDAQVAVDAEVIKGSKVVLDVQVAGVRKS